MKSIGIQKVVCWCEEGYLPDRTFDDKPVFVMCAACKGKGYTEEEAFVKE